ncbi:hypothetical protein BRD17_00610 [Halobacteriales archaeon SW_7_68_16]|nr:MAG: hypothetical protein BRD17_00610 [Halobacteriales archaeon SW_7_68_16]
METSLYRTGRIAVATLTTTAVSAIVSPSVRTSVVETLNGSATVADVGATAAVLLPAVSTIVGGMILFLTAGLWGVVGYLLVTLGAAVFVRAPQAGALAFGVGCLVLFVALYAYRGSDDEDVPPEARAGLSSRL